MRLLYVLLFAVIVGAASAVSFSEVIKAEWQAFKLEHGKYFADEVEERFRLKIFNENKYKIAHHNELYAAGKVSYKLGLNKYADMLHHEFRQTMNGYNHTQKLRLRNDENLRGATFLPSANLNIPKSIDWRKEGAVTAIKDQGHCGSCWAFSSTGALEGQHFRKTGKLVSLSEQNLVDCSSSYGNNGCNGGEMDNAFNYIKENGGIDTEESYPYEGIDDSCHFRKSNVAANDRGFVDITPGDEHKLLNAVASVGPVSVAIDASHESFQFYKEGVYHEPECDSQQLDHGVLVVGYGTDRSGTDYWLVKNSWGTTWGDEGYVKMSRNKHNQCGIASSASYPLV